MKADKLLKRAVHMANVLRNSTYSERKANDFRFEAQRQERSYEQQKKREKYMCSVTQGDPMSLHGGVHGWSKRVHVQTGDETKEGAAEACLVELISRILVENEKLTDTNIQLTDDQAKGEERYKKVVKNWEARLGNVIKQMHNDDADHMRDFIDRFEKLKVDQVTVKFIMRELRVIYSKNKKICSLYNNEQAVLDIEEY